MWLTLSADLQKVITQDIRSLCKDLLGCRHLLNNILQATALCHIDDDVGMYTKGKVQSRRGIEKVPLPSQLFEPPAQGREKRCVA